MTGATRPAAGTRPAALFRHALTGDGRGWRLGLAVLGFCGHQLAEVMVPVTVGLVIDRAIGPGAGHELAGTLLLLVAVFVVLVASWQSADRLATRVHARGEHSLRQRTVESVLRGRRVRRAPGEVLTISSSDAAQIAGISWVVLEQAGAVAALVAAGMVLAWISWPLAAGVLLCTLLQVVVVHLMSGRLRRRSYDAQRQAARIDALGTDFTLGLRALEALGATAEATTRYRAESGRAARAGYLFDRANAGLSMVSALAAGITFAAIAAIAGALALGGMISIGAFITAVGLAQAVRRPLQTIGYLPGALAAKHGSARRLGELLEQATPEPGPTGHPETAAAEAGLIVEFSVAGHRIGVSPGLIVGIRAPEPAATDLADLLGARRTARPGELVVGGTDASVLAAAVLRRSLFAPPHDALLFSGSVRENLGIRDDSPAGRGAGIIEASGLDEVLTRLPAGLDEDIGENGGRLSGGQRQRLMLARALGTDQAVLVLHEPTSAVDPVTEARIARRVVDHLRRNGRSAVFITGSAVFLGLCDEVHTLDPAVREMAVLESALLESALLESGPAA